MFHPQTLEEGKCKLEGDVQSQEGFIRMLEEDLSQRNQDLIQMEETLADKDEVIRCRLSYPPLVIICLGSVVTFFFCILFTDNIVENNFLLKSQNKF